MEIRNGLLAEGFPTLGEWWVPGDAFHRGQWFSGELEVSYSPEGQEWRAAYRARHQGVPIGWSPLFVGATPNEAAQGALSWAAEQLAEQVRQLLESWEREEDPEESSSLEEILISLRNRWVAGGGSLQTLERQVGRKLPAWLK